MDVGIRRAGVRRVAAEHGHGIVKSRSHVDVVAVRADGQEVHSQSRSIESLDDLAAARIDANVRYFPFCLLKGYESLICNNAQVMFDPFSPLDSGELYVYDRDAFWECL